MNYKFTSESVSGGHPDKVADQISDAILDALLEKDPNSRVACETLISSKLVVLAGEISTTADINYPNIVRKVIKDIGYDNELAGFDSNRAPIILSFEKQSADIAMGVDSSDKKEQGAGDQGIMFGYAVNETPNLMPISIYYSNMLMKRISEVRKKGIIKGLFPDSKGQVTVDYIDGQPRRIDTIVISAHHEEGVSIKKLKEEVYNEVVLQVIPEHLIDSNVNFLFNPTGKFTIGGPQADCGLTGRKIVVDTYGGHGAHGGGAFSGKDPSKVDRSAAYLARHIAKNIVGAKLADKCLVQLSYVIGKSNPVSLMINDYNTAKVEVSKIEKAVREIWNFSPKSIINDFELLKPIYLKTASYGHFGRNEEEFTWEKLNKVNELKNL